MEGIKKYRIGLIEVMAEDLSLKDVHGRKTEAWKYPWGWENFEGGSALAGQGWRLPNIDELYYIGGLMELGVLNLNTEAGYSKETGSYDAGYWSGQETLPGNEDYLVMVIYDNPRGEKVVIGDNVRPAGGPRYFRVRLVRDL